MRRDIEFNADGVTLRGWFYTPDQGKGPFPCVVMAHGFSGTKEMTLDRFAEVFAAAGLAVLVYDNRNLGSSGGEPRSEIDPTWQRRDYRTAISYAQLQPEVDPARIGIWGTSYTGGTVCAVAAIDRRVKAVVSQVPFMRGHHNLQQFLPITARFSTVAPIPISELSPTVHPCSIALCPTVTSAPMVSGTPSSV